MSSAANDEKYIHLAGNPYVLTVVDYGCYQVSLNIRRSWILYNRRLTTPETPPRVWRGTFVGEPDMVAGSVKMGQPILHPRYKFKGTRVTFNILGTGTLAFRIAFFQWNDPTPTFNVEYVIPVWQYSAAPLLYIPCGPPIRFMNNFGHKYPGA